MNIKIPNEEQIKEFDTFPPLLRTLLANRGIKNTDEAEEYLNPDYERHTYDPFGIADMDKAVARIVQAIDNEEKVVVYGDYDCDGIPGTAVLHDFFKKIGYQEKMTYYIPHRHTEGYGLNTDAIDQFAKDGNTLLITVDCGITDIDEVAYANKLGIDVIVTDHHLVVKDEKDRDVLPPAFAVLNSKRVDDTYPDEMLCGAGVAFKLVQALLTRGRETERQWVNHIQEGWEKWLLDMAGLSTIADMVPLQKENRALAHYGLKVMRKSPRPGLQALLKKMNVDQRRLTEDDVGFMIGPRINAASRMDVPFEAFRLLSTDDEVLASELANHLHTINDQRKGTVAAIMKEARKKLSDKELGDVIVIGNPKWRVGVLGIAASNLVEEFERPAFVWGREGSADIKGSCRSDGNVDVVELMHAVADGVFLGVGGHAASGGFSVSHEHIHFLEKELNEAYTQVEKKRIGEEDQWIDTELSLDDVTRQTYREIARLAPFGMGNPKPTFLFKNIKIAEVHLFGKEKNHLRLVFRNSRNQQVIAIGFFMNAETFEAEVRKDTSIDLIATMEESWFRGRPELRLRIVDITSVA